MRLRRWLHEHGYHALCRIRTVPTYGSLVPVKGEMYDVTNQDSVRQTVHT